MRMEEKIVLATSVQHPCAHAIVLGFAREGANCVVVDEDRSQAEQLAAQVRSLGRRALPLQFDVTQKSQVEEIVKRAVTEFGRIDVLLNCSGITHEADFLTLTEQAFNQCIDRGPKAYFLTSQAVGRQMAEQRSGKIINLLTTDARIGSGESTANSVAYSSIDSMTRAIRPGAGILWCQRKFTRQRADEPFFPKCRGSGRAVATYSLWPIGQTPRPSWRGDLFGHGRFEFCRR
jgi:3-oxoacyl-[acyl-carrier protein] reductase